jgi:ABC-type multidrug transport system permease subunit
VSYFDFSDVASDCQSRFFSAASAVLTLLAAVPVLRFRRMPGNLLASGLIAWFFFSLWYRVLCFFYHNLGDPPHSTFHVFMMGSVVYLILTTLSWIGTIVRRARAAHSSQPNRPMS